MRSYVPRIVGRDRTLSLLALVDDSVRTALTRVPDALGGDAMLQTYSDWIAGIAADEPPSQPQQQLEAPTAAAAGASMAPAQSPSDGATARSTQAHSLQDVCELVMYRNDGLRRLNRSLVHQISKLESDLAHTHATLVYAQRTIAQLKELDAVRAQRLVVRASAALSQRDAPTPTAVTSPAAVAHQAPARVPTGDSLKLSQDDALDALNAVGRAAQATAPASSSSSSQSGSDSGDDQPQDEQQHLADASQSDDEPETSNYCDLVALHAPSEREDADWHRKALRRLTREREQRRSARSECASESSTPRRARFSFASSVEMDDALSYQELVAMRSSDADDDIVAWQRQSLHRLSHERTQRSSRTSAVSSVSPTNSSTSTLGAFAGDEY